MRQPRLNVNYVKKVVFPLEILPWVAMGSAVFHGAISLVVLLAALLLTHATVPWTVVLFPSVLLPFLCATIGTAWFSSLGVYIRDIAQTTGILTTILLFVSPVFFPVSAVPPQFQTWMRLNPLTFVINPAAAYSFSDEASIAGMDMLSGRQSRHCVGWILVVSENKKRIRRCHLKGRVW